jgi:uncharacterized membrane protein
MVRARVARPSGWLASTYIHHTLKLLLASGFAGGLLAVRIIFSREVTFIFLVWNLLLAWLPFILSGLTFYAHRRRRWGVLLLFAGLWLLFFPNAPYILTDLLHLTPRAPIPLWYDLLLLAAFAWTGIFLALASLATMHAIVRERGGWLGGWLFAGAALALGSLGVYFGRFLRWNSWDVFFQPAAVLSDLGVRLIHPLAHCQAYKVSIPFFIFLFVCYLTLGSARHTGSA